MIKKLITFTGNAVLVNRNLLSKTDKHSFIFNIIMILEYWIRFSYLPFQC